MTLDEIKEYKEYATIGFKETKEDALLLLEICEKALQDVEKITKEKELIEFLEKYDNLLDDEKFNHILIGE